jgi:hypothetical protein
MKSILGLLARFSALRAFALISVFTVAAPTQALDLNISNWGAIVTIGSGTSTVVGLTENPDGTISLAAEQSGYLSRLGNFTGSFDYLATIDYNTGNTFIGGEGVIRLPAGNLFVSVQIIEVGLDYPRPYTGLLKITKGTGRFAGAHGFFEIKGVDEESPTDGFRLAGLIITTAAK